MPQPRFFFNSCGIWESIPPAAAISQTVIEKKLLLVKAPQRRPENLTAAMCFFSFPEAAVVAMKHQPAINEEVDPMAG